MRIALMSDAVWPTPLEGGHGLGRAVYNLGRELVKRGHAVTLLGAEGSALAGARVWTVPGGGGFGHEPTMARMVTEHAGSLTPSSTRHIRTRWRMPAGRCRAWRGLRTASPIPRRAGCS